MTILKLSKLKPALLVPVFLLLCAASAQATTFAIALYPHHGEDATLQDTIDALDDIKSAGVTGIAITHTWQELNPSGNTYIVQQFAKDLTFNVNEGREVFFGFQPINTTGAPIPDDLKTKSWDDPELAKRYGELLDHLAAESPTPPKYVSIGNEVDVYLGLHPEQTVPFLKFYAQAAALTRQKFPNTKIGITVTYEGLVGGRKDLVKQLIAASDIAIFTFYPMVNLQLEAPQRADDDLDTMTAAAGTKAVVLQEVGYPSSDGVRSTEGMQSDFLRRAIWGIRDHHQIVFANLFMLYDFSPDFCDQALNYYGFANQSLDVKHKFHAFLCSLGFKRFSGREKTAWKTVKDNLKAPGRD